MDAVYLTLFVSTVLAALGLVLFVFTHGQRTRDHNYRLALLPLDDPPETVAPPASAPTFTAPLAPPNPHGPTAPTAGADLR